MEKASFWSVQECRCNCIVHQRCRMVKSAWFTGMFENSWADMCLKASADDLVYYQCLSVRTNNLFRHSGAIRGGVLV